VADYTVKRIEDMEAIYRGSFRKARAELGVSSFGMQIIDMPPGVTAYPEHDHAEDGQEEVYVVLRGSAEVEIEGDTVTIDRDTIVRVGPGTSRKILPGSEGVRILALGGVAGQPYSVREFTELGQPDPMSQ
jgi:mannose-6-phosphate isomerase-like protein (cupin superfamily)